MEKICFSQQCNENCIESEFIPIGQCIKDGKSSFSYACGSYSVQNQGSPTATFFQDSKCQKGNGQSKVSEGCTIVNGNAVKYTCARSFFYPLGYFLKTVYNSSTSCEGDIQETKEYARGDCVSENGLNFKMTACNTPKVDQILVLVVSIGTVVVGCFGFLSFSLFFAYLSSHVVSLVDTESKGYTEI
jgi:hypothetical protein